MDFTIGSSSFVQELLFPRLAAEAGVTCRGLTVPDHAAESYVRRGLVDAIVSVGSELRLVFPWSSRCVGEMRYGLFAAPELARSLGPNPNEDALRAAPFVAPAWVSPALDLVRGDDFCPLPRAERYIRHEVETMRLGCIVAAETGALVFGPAVAACACLATGSLVEVDMPGWSVSESIHLACSEATVPASLRSLLAQTIKDLFSPVLSASGVVDLVSGTGTTRSRARSES